MNNIEETKKIKEWLKENNIELPLETKRNENESLSCIPIKEVDKLLINFLWKE